MQLLYVQTWGFKWKALEIYNLCAEGRAPVDDFNCVYIENAAFWNYGFVLAEHRSTQHQTMNGHDFLVLSFIAVKSMAPPCLCFCEFTDWTFKGLWGMSASCRDWGSKQWRLHRYGPLFQRTAPLQFANSSPQFATSHIPVCCKCRDYCRCKPAVWGETFAFWIFRIFQLVRRLLKQMLVFVHYYIQVVQHNFNNQ